MTFIDACGVGGLVRLRKKASELKVTFYVRDPAPPVRRLLDLLGVDEWNLSFVPDPIWAES